MRKIMRLMILISLKMKMKMSMTSFNKKIRKINPMIYRKDYWQINNDYLVLFF